MYPVPKKLPIGIVTRTDEYIIYVWAHNFGQKELRYPLSAIPNIEPGDRVRFYQREEFCKIQSARDIFMEKVLDLSISKLPRTLQSKEEFRFKIYTHVIFPPITYAPYQNYVDTVRTCKAIAFSPQFHRVACFRDMNYKPGVLYKAYVSRIPKAFDSLVSEVETLFTFVDIRLNEVYEESVVKSVLEIVPWHSQWQCRKGDQQQHHFQRLPENLRKKLSMLTTSYATPSQTPCSYGQYKKSQINGVHRALPLTSNGGSETSVGIVVRVEKNHAVIWSRHHGLVFVPQSDCLNLSCGSATSATRTIQ
uniref:BAH domain-containing protein n=1 Tax=Ditylenchus dipsaci TaxID=166011 RepID=A0A915DJD2_9BILA